MQADHAIRVLPMCDVLSGFDINERQTLASYGEFLVLNANETVIQEQQEQDSLYFLIKGTLRALHHAKEGKRPVGTIRAGEWFGEINILHPCTATAEVMTLEQSHVWRIPRSKLEQFLNDAPVLGCKLLLAVSEGLARRTRKILADLNARPPY